MRSGDISVSGVHANYFVNEGEGRCEDFLRLIEDVVARVQEHSGADLEPEVKMWGI